MTTSGNERAHLNLGKLLRLPQIRDFARALFVRLPED
jgi:hypothetical protein